VSDRKLSINAKPRPDVKRDMELVKRILAEVESWPDESPRDVVVEGYEQHVVARHLEMLAAAGFLDVYVQPDPEAPIRVRDLSWKGHEYFDGLGRPNLESLAPP
jgi:Hypothetical protein (DUF2513)